MKKVIKLFVLTLLAGSVFVACNSNDDNNPNNDNKGEVKVKITDAPFPVDFVTQANVGVAKVELKNQNGEYVTVFDGNTNFNMVNLTNGETETVASATIQTGTYTEAKITLNSASVSLTNGTVFDLNSQAQGSYSVTINPSLVIEDNKDSDVLLDLDLNHSFQFTTGSFMNWITDIMNITGCDFQADFRACDLNQTGKIQGTVKDANNGTIANALVTVTVDGNEVSTLSDYDGKYAFIGIKQGSYTLHVETQNDGQTDVSGVQVSIDTTTEANVVLN